MSQVWMWHSTYVYGLTRYLQVVWYLVYSFPCMQSVVGILITYYIMCTMWLHARPYDVFVLDIHVSIVQHSVLIDSQLYTMLIHGIELATNTQCCTMETWINTSAWCRDAYQHRGSTMETWMLEHKYILWTCMKPHIVQAIWYIRMLDPRTHQQQNANHTCIHEKLQTHTLYPFLFLKCIHSRSLPVATTTSSSTALVLWEDTRGVFMRVGYAPLSWSDGSVTMQVAYIRTLTFSWWINF